MSLIEKIDAVYNEHPYKVVGDVSTYSQYNEGWSDACDRLTAVLTEQKEPIGNSEQLKEPCHICQDTSNDRYYRNQGYKYCPHCGYSLDATDNNVVTIGDKIRESNEILADAIQECGIINCFQCPAETRECAINHGCGEAWLNFLNQPYPIQPSTDIS